MKNILLVLTGGTICSFQNENGEQTADGKRAKALIVQNFRNSDSAWKSKRAVRFTTRQPLNVLSENMTVAHWNTLINRLKSYNLEKFDGAIILHGTDTLHLTAPLLSLLLAGINRPVFLVSSNLPLYNPAANGNDNFRVAVEHIARGIAPNIYVPYKNADKMYIHFAAHLTSCPNHSDNFYSEDMHPLEKGEFFGCSASPDTAPLLYSCPKLRNCVLRITPYAGIDYSRYNLRGVSAVLHHTYHSETLSVNGDGKASVLSLKKRCDKAGAELYIEPCNPDKAYLYETTGELLRCGVGTSHRTTSEMAYVKLLVGCAIGMSGKTLQDFINREINGEFLR